jgi:hypothetical protein
MAGMQLARARELMNDRLANVGAPDPELQNSPIVDELEYDEQAASRDLELEEGACYFNGVAYPIGAYVRSGSEVLQCSGRGVWERKAEREGPA